MKNGTTNINSRCGTSRYKHIVKRAQKVAKQIGVPNQNRRLFLRNKLTLVVYSCESLAIPWSLLIVCSNTKTKSSLYRDRILSFDSAQDDVRLSGVEVLSTLNPIH